MMIILFISDLGRLTYDDYTIYIRSRSVNRWWFYNLYQIYDDLQIIKSLKVVFVLILFSKDSLFILYLFDFKNLTAFYNKL